MRALLLPILILSLLFFSAFAEDNSYKVDLDNDAKEEVVTIEDKFETDFEGVVTVSSLDGSQSASFSMPDHIGEVEFIDLTKSGLKQIVAWSRGGMHYMNIAIYGYLYGKLYLLFQNGSACGIDTDFDTDRPVIKVGRANWGAKVITEDGKEINWSYASEPLWQVYAWNGEEFVYDEKLSTTPEISEKEEVQRFVDKAMSLLKKKSKEKPNNEHIDFQGDWFAEGKDWTFNIKLEQQGQKLKGRYCAVAYNGNRIDCDPNSEANISGNIIGNVAEVTFRTYYGRGMGKSGEDIGKAEIIHKGDKIEWIVTQAPKNGYYYCPNKTALTRNNEPEKTQKAADESEFVIHNDSVGGIRPGDSIDTVYRAYLEEQVKLVNFKGYAEGMFFPGLAVFLDDPEEESLHVLIGFLTIDGVEEWTIDNIFVVDERFKTDRGIGPGSTIKDLRNKYELDSVDFFEGRLYIRVKEFEGIFVTQFGGFSEEFIKRPDAPFSLIPDELVIEQVRI